MARGGQGKTGAARQRTCLGCRQVRTKGELVRLVVAPAGLVVDRRQRLSGRGAYVCPSSACVQKAARHVGKALRTGGLGTSAEQLGRLVSGELDAVAASVAPAHGPPTGGDTSGETTG